MFRAKFSLVVLPQRKWPAKSMTPIYSAMEQNSDKAFVRRAVIRFIANLQSCECEQRAGAMA